jgi:MFS family permease
MLVCMVAVLLGAILLTATLNLPLDNRVLFTLLLSATALFIPFASANVVSTVADVTLPEVRSTAMAVQYFIESGGAALSPWIAGFIAVRTSLGQAILWICVLSWILCAAFFAAAAMVIPHDVATLRATMEQRAQRERRRTTT